MAGIREAVAAEVKAFAEAGLEIRAKAVGMAEVAMVASAEEEDEASGAVTKSCSNNRIYRELLLFLFLMSYRV